MGWNRRSLTFFVLCIATTVLGALVGFLVAQRINTAAPQAQISTSATATPNATSQTATADHNAQVAVTIQALTGGVLLEEPLVFSADEQSSDILEIQNTDKGLRITAKVPPNIIFTIAEKDLPYDVDASVTLQVVPPDACQESSYGLNFRQQLVGNETGSFYRFSVRLDHKWYFVYYDPQGDGYIIATGNVGGSVDLHQPTTLRVVAKGSHVELFINGMQVGSADYSTRLFDKNKVGVGVATCSKPATGLFTNLLVSTPN